LVLFFHDKDTEFQVGMEMKERLYVLYLLFRMVIKSFFSSDTLYIIGMVKGKGVGKLLMIISGCRLMKKRVWKITGSDFLVV